MSRTLDREGVLRILPHREPFVFLHGVRRFEPGIRAEGWVTIPKSHPYALGQETIPAGLVIEAMAQIGCVAAAESDETPMRGLFRAIQGFRMEGSVAFGERLDLAAEVTKKRGRLIEVKARALVGDREAAEAVLSFAAI